MGEEMELVLIFVAGMLGSSHCVGMCGGFAVMVGLRAPGAAAMAVSQCVFTLGRIFTYAVFGVLAGSLGARVTTLSNAGVNILALLSVVAGLLLLVQGMATLGVRLFPSRFRSSGVCLMASGYRSLLEGGGWPQTFLAGLFTGMLPCGLVYGFVSLAAATGDPLRGAVVMSLFGLGTAPLMIAVGWGGSLLSVLARQRLLKLAAACVVVMGAVTLTRGITHLTLPESGGRPTCPFCLGAGAEEISDGR
jgi:sulfite exporter TauE/SafE